MGRARCSGLAVASVVSGVVLAATLAEIDHCHQGNFRPTQGGQIVEKPNEGEERHFEGSLEQEQGRARLQEEVVVVPVVEIH